MVTRGGYPRAVMWYVMAQPSGISASSPHLLWAHFIESSLAEGHTGEGISWHQSIVPAPLAALLQV